MNILTVENLSKQYGAKALFNQVSFSIRSDNRIGIVGVNGSGKTTLLKMLMDIETPDAGSIVKNPKAQIAYLPQNPVMNDQDKVLDYIFAGQSPTMRLLRNYRNAAHALSKTPNTPSVQQAFTAASQKMDTENGWAAEANAKATLTKLGITDFEAKLGELSGGQRRRVAMARVLLDPADLIVLDEPTNHIDPDTIIWLENYLSTIKSALLMVTHDRYFLDRVANHIFEIADGNIHNHRGNYSEYLKNRTAREALREQQAMKRKSFLQKELEWLKRTPMARGGKQKARIQRAESLQNKELTQKNSNLSINVAGRRTGKQIIELYDVSKSFDGKTVVKNFSYIVNKGARLGIVGANGAGKSTLLNLIARRLEPDSGKIVIGATIHLGYYDQESTALNENQRIIDNITDVAEVIRTADGSKLSAAQMLERFRFSRPMQLEYISTLSGGERRRLYLLRTLMMAPNVLLLDEPTNDLDIETLSILEDYLDDFDGVLIVVSHDRYFLDRTVEHIFAFEKDGIIKEYPGNYSAYQAKKTKAPSISKAVKSKNNGSSKPRKLTSTKLSFKEKQELAALETHIAELEAEKIQLGEAINVAGDDYQQLQNLSAKFNDVDTKLDAAIERWAILEERNSR